MIGQSIIVPPPPMLLRQQLLLFIYLFELVFKLQKQTKLPSI